MRGLPVVVAALAAGCGASAGADLFERDMLDVSIEMPPADWDAMRLQYKSRHSTFGTTDCRSAPVVNPYTWFPTTITIDGTTVAMTGLRKKGHFGSQSTLKPSLKLRFDEFVDGQRYDGEKRLALNNSKNDPSFARTCLGYEVFAAAGIPAPRCTFAHVKVNGQDMGPYVVTEEMDKAFLARHFASNEGNLYEGTACDFRPEYVGGFEQETNEDTDASHADLLAVLDVAVNAPDGELLARLEPLVNLDAFFRFWAVEVLVWHRDGYAGNANNYFVYADPDDGGRFRFLPWGPDSAFRPDNRAEVPDSVLAYGMLANRLYALPEGRARFYQQLDELLATVWKPAELSARAARIAEQVAPLLDDPYRAEMTAQTAEVQGFIAGRADGIAAARAAGDPAWTDGLRTTPCRTPLGPVTGTFTTTWDSLAVDAFAAGTGTFTAELDGAPVPNVRVGARSGPTAGPQDRVQMTVDTSATRRLIVNTVFATGTYYPFFEPYGVVGDHRLVQPPVNMTVIEQDISVSPAVELRDFEIGEGTWTYDEFQATTGAPVSGHFTGTLYEVPDF